MNTRITALLDAIKAGDDVRDEIQAELKDNIEPLLIPAMNSFVSERFAGYSKTFFCMVGYSSKHGQIVCSVSFADNAESKSGFGMACREFESFEQVAANLLSISSHYITTDMH